jgi:hypothetical protein
LPASISWADRTASFCPEFTLVFIVNLLAVRLQSDRFLGNY